MQQSDGMQQTGVLEGAGLRCQSRPPPRILVVDDEQSVRQLNAQMLLDAGYHVDAVEDGAAAWDTLRAKNYDLLITDHMMPKVSGIELIGKVRSAGMDLPVILATGAVPHEEFTRQPWLRPAATLVKPYTFAEFLGTVRSVLCGTVLMVMLQLCLPPASNAQTEMPPPSDFTAQTAVQPPSDLHFVSRDSADRPNALAFSVAGSEVINAREMKQAPDPAPRPDALTLSVRGKCDYSEDGVTFTKLERGHIFGPGTVIRTGGEAWTDLIFRRAGATVRLQAGTEIKIEQIAPSLPVAHTSLDLRAGRIFTIVRSAVAGNTLEIRNAAVRSVVEGSGIGRYIITADGTYVSATGSVIPLKVMSENGTTIIGAGQQFTRKDGNMLPTSSGLCAKDLIQLDELQAATEKLFPEEPFQ